MRPTRVEIEGFASFRSSTVVDFGDADLVAFVGPTGSGKSSIIDALTFALYGSVARYRKASLVQPVITQGENEARVRFDFELGGKAYVAVRIVRRTQKGASTKEARLELLSEDEPGGSKVLAAGAKEVSLAVEELLGLDFLQFTRSVVLPQGDFAQFLNDEPAKRQELLRRLLDMEVYSKMGRLARQEAKTAASNLKLLNEQVERNADVTPESLLRARKLSQGLKALVSESDSVGGEVDLIELGLEDLRRQARDIASKIERLAEVAVPAELVDHDSRRAVASQAVVEANKALDEARQSRDEAVAAATELAEPAEIRARLATLDRRKQLAEEQEKLNLEGDGLKKVVASGKTELDSTDKALTAALERQAMARKSADAAHWVDELSVGEPCPVCRQVVTDMPSHDGDAELAEAKRQLDELQKARDLLAKSHNKASLALASNESRRQVLAEAHEGDRAEAPEGDRAELESQLKAAELADKQVATAEKAWRETEKAFGRASVALTSFDTAERDQRQAYGEARDAVAALDPPSPQEQSILANWEMLCSWAETKAEEMVKTREQILAEGKGQALLKQEKLENLVAKAASFELSSEPSGASNTEVGAELRRLIVDSAARSEAEAASLATRLDGLKGQRNEIKALEGQRQVDEMLGRQLDATGFDRWLLAEAVTDLVERATRWLLELSGGKFSLTSTETHFEIIDHGNADQCRDARTLSGGETFLASLALALALSDSISELAPAGAPRLESMFLDEGFGTLDPETLDLVASAIEELSAAGRLVGIVTHIEALAERMPVRFAVTKGPATSRVERLAS